MFNNSKLIFCCLICLLFLSNCKTTDVLEKVDISQVNNQNRNANITVNNQNRNANVHNGNDNGNMNSENPYGSPFGRSTPIPITPPTSKELELLRNSGMESITYGVVLENAFVYSSEEQYKPLREFGIIGFRKNSVEPTGFNEFAQRNPFNLSSEILENFKTNNQKKLALREDGYDCKCAIAPVSGEGDSQEVLKAAKTKKVKGIKQEKIGVLIGLSRIGFSKDLTQTLLYAEYTTPKSHLKMYIYTPFEITENGVYAQRKEMKIDYIQ